MLNGKWILGAVVMCLLGAGLASGVPAQVLPVAGDSGLAPHNPFTPPPCVAGVPFADVRCSTFYDAWIEQFAADGINSGCGNGNYCPNENVTRAQMAVFIEAAMHGTANWSPGNLGNYNTGLGSYALYNNTGYAQENTAVGYAALDTQSFGNGNVPYPTQNTAVGDYTLYYNQPDGGSGGLSGTRNTAVGSSVLFSDTTGFENVGVGAVALDGDQTGFRNTAIGYEAGFRNGEVITGYAGSNVTFAKTVAGSYNTFVGMAGSTTDVSNCTALAQDAHCAADDEVRLGNVYVTSIGGKVGWSALSDARAKRDVEPLGLGLDFLMALRPVSFTMKQGDGRTDMGFIAQDVEALLGDTYSVLGIGGDADRTLSLRYTDFIAPMVRAIQEQEAKITARRSAIDALQRDNADLKARLAALEAKVAGASR